MKKTPLLVSVFATGSMLAFGLVGSASAQQVNDPFAPLGALVAAPVTAAGDIAAAPLDAAGNVVGAPLTAAGELATAPLAATGLMAPGAPVGQSARTAAFVANALPNINFLNDSSRMALDKSRNPAIRNFAHHEAKIQTIAGNSVIAWTNTTPGTITGRSAYNSDPLMGVFSLPGNVIDATGDALSGGMSNGMASNSQTQDLSRLSGLNGAEFDRLYRSTQLDSLNQLATLYSDYAANGDDPGLRRLARSELPKIKHEIALISRI